MHGVLDESFGLEKVIQIVDEIVSEGNKAVVVAGWRSRGEEIGEALLEVGGEEGAEGEGVRDEALFAGVGLAVEGEEEVEVASEEGGQAMVNSDSVAAGERVRDLVKEGEAGTAEERVVLGDDGATEGLGVGLVSDVLEASEPAVGVDQGQRGAEVVPKAGRVADRRFVANEESIELVLDPSGGTVHDVDRKTAGCIDPAVAWFPEVVIELARQSIRTGDGGASGDWDGGLGVDIEVEIGPRVGGRRGEGAGKGNGGDSPDGGESLGDDGGDRGNLRVRAFDGAPHGRGDAAASARRELPSTSN